MRRHTMVSSVRNDVHPALSVTGFAQVLDGLRTTLRVHPVIVTVCRTGSGVAEY